MSEKKMTKKSLSKCFEDPDPISNPLTDSESFRVILLSL